MSMTHLGGLSLDISFLSSLLSIVVIDLILAGDNAVVIAMAVRSLPRHQRKKGIFFGAGAAVLLRVFATFFVAQLLQINFIRLLGGAVILWIAVKLFVEGVPHEDGHRQAVTVAQAVKVIVVADITMATDNMLAVAGASQGNLLLLLFGLGLSIPFVVFTSNLLSVLMDRYPAILYIGAAILGKVGGEMIVTDPFTAGIVGSSRTLVYAAEAACAGGVIAAGLFWTKRMSSRRDSSLHLHGGVADTEGGESGTEEDTCQS